MRWRCGFVDCGERKPSPVKFIKLSLTGRALFNRSQAVNCLATIIESLRDKTRRTCRVTATNCIAPSLRLTEVEDVDDDENEAPGMEGPDFGNVC